MYIGVVDSIEGLGNGYKSVTFDCYMENQEDTVIFVVTIPNKIRLRSLESGTQYIIKEDSTGYTAERFLDLAGAGIPCTISITEFTSEDTK